MRSPVDNPFTPGSDTVPSIWAGRDDQLADWERVVRPRRLAGLPERGRTILGEAGLGKSSLVRRIADSARNAGDWVTPQVRIPRGADPLKTVATALLALAGEAGLAGSREHRIGELLDRVRSVSVSGISLSLDRATGPEPFMSLTSLLAEVARAAVPLDKMVLVHIDEMHNVTNGAALSQLLVALGDALSFEFETSAPGGYVVRRCLPVAVYLTGLPDFADLSAAPTGATFVRRFATTVLEPIDDDDFLAALGRFVSEGWETPDSEGGVDVVGMTPDAANRIAELACGEPFLFQLAGAGAWSAGASSTITVDDVNLGWARATYEATSHVERILQRLPQKERELIDAMAALPSNERFATNIAQQMGLADAVSLGSAAQRLDTVRGIISRGKPYTFRHRAIEAYLTTGWPSVEP